MKTKLTLLAAALFASVATPACIIVDDDDGHYYDDDGHYHDDIPPAQSTVFTTIDADHLLDTDLGQGAGLFVEYSVGGRWTIWTSCDTSITGAVCNFEAHVTAHSGGISDVFEYDTEGFDAVEVGDRALSFYAETGHQSDAVEFYADPGALVQIELILDGYAAPEYLVWYGNGFVHDGATGTPVVFQPDQP